MLKGQIGEALNNMNVSKSFTENYGSVVFFCVLFENVYEIIPN